MTIFKTCIGVTLLGAILGFAQEKSNTSAKQLEKETPKIVRVQVEYIEVAHETMTELLSEPRTSADDTPLRAKLQGLVKEGKAKVIETQMVTVRSGHKATSESIHEYIYPTEYEAPKLVMNNVPENDKPETLPPVERPPFPSAWETRNLGSTLEIEPNTDVDGKVIDLLLLPTLLYHAGNNVWHEEIKGEDTYRVQMPNFYKVEVNNSMTLIAGQPFLMAAVSPKNEKGEADFTKKVLIFVRADVLTVGK